MGVVQSSVNFDANTGRVTATSKSADGKSSSEATFIPNDQLQDLEQYISFVQQNMKEGQAASKDYPKSVGSVNMGKAGRAEAVAAGADLPRLQAWQIKEPAARAVVYTGADGKSRFLYVSDPTKIIELIPGGSRIQQAAVKVAAAQDKVVAVRDAGQQKMQCLSESVLSVVTMDQRTQIDNAFKSCITKFGTQKSAEAPAPAAGTSTYAAQGGVYPIQGGGYPMWVVILSIVSIVAALVMAKKS